VTQDKNETRFHRRIPVAVPAAVFGTAPDREEIALRTIDLSAGGALCRSEVRLEVGLPVDLRLDLTDEAGAPHPVALQAMVVRVEGTGPWSVAFHFLDVPERVRDRLQRFLLHLTQVAGP